MEILLMYGLFIGYFLVPLIPAVVIYKLFPDSRVQASGPFNGLSIKTSGAFAAYMIALISGIFIVNNTMDLIKEEFKQKTSDVDFLWQVKSRLIFENENGAEEYGSDLINSIEPKLEPEWNDSRSIEDLKIIYIPNSIFKNNVAIKFTGNQCQTKKICPNNPGSYKIDNDKKIIDIGEIRIKRASIMTDTYRKDTAISPEQTIKSFSIKN